MIPGSNKDHPSFLKSFSYAMEGFVTAVKTERNIKVMLVAGVCTVIAGCIVGLDIAEWATIIICCGLVIHGELCNTAMVSAAWDRSMPRILRSMWWMEYLCCPETSERPAVIPVLT